MEGVETGAGTVNNRSLAVASSRACVCSNTDC